MGRLVSFMCPEDTAVRHLSQYDAINTTLARRLQWRFWLQTNGSFSSGHLEYVAAAFIHWMKFFTSVILKDGYVN